MTDTAPAEPKKEPPKRLTDLSHVCVQRLCEHLKIFSGVTDKILDDLGGGDEEIKSIKPDVLDRGSQLVEKAISETASAIASIVGKLREQDRERAHEIDQQTVGSPGVYEDLLDDTIGSMEQVSLSQIARESLVNALTKNLLAADARLRAFIDLSQRHPRLGNLKRICTWALAEEGKTAFAAVMEKASTPVERAMILQQLLVRAQALDILERIQEQRQHDDRTAVAKHGTATEEEVYAWLNDDGEGEQDEWIDQIPTGQESSCKPIAIAFANLHAKADKMKPVIQELSDSRPAKKPLPRP